MLENNAFRSYMLVGGIMTLAMFLIMFFKIPLIDIDESAKANYENVMNVELDADTDSLTAYQAVLYSIQGKTRGRVNHY